MEVLTAQRSRTIPVPRRATLVVLRAIAAALIALAALVAAVGVLYLIRKAGPLAIGPKIPGALPLQQLAGGEGQPLLRMAIAWMPAGFVAGLALASLTRLGARLRMALLAAMAALVLLLAGAVADAIAITDPLGPHLLPQLTRVGTWTAVALFALGSTLVERLRTIAESPSEG
jgi:hypothetical protein